MGRRAETSTWVVRRCETSFLQVNLTGSDAPVTSSDAPVPSSFLLLVVLPGASSFLLLEAMHQC